MDMLSDYLDHIQQMFYPIAAKGIIVMSSIPSICMLLMTVSKYLYLSHCQLAQALECYLGKIEYIGLRTLLYFTCAMTCLSLCAAQGRVDCRELENHHYQGMQVWIEQVLAVLSAWRWTAQTTCYP